MRHLSLIRATRDRNFSILRLRRLFQFFGATILLSLTMQVQAADASYLQERVEARTSAMQVSETGYAVGVIYRRLITLVKHGKSYGLSESDTRQIKNIKHPIEDAAAAMRPMMTELYHGLRQGYSAYDLALLLKGAAEAERSYMNQFYAEAVAGLSQEAQEILAKEFAKELLTVKTFQTDFVGVAEDYPEGAMFMLSAAAENFNQAHGVASLPGSGVLHLGSGKNTGEEKR